MNGFWGCINSAGGLDILSFEDEKFEDYTYQGCAWVIDGRVEKIDEISETEVKVTVSYKEAVLGEGKSDEYATIEYVFESNDDFRKNMIMRNGDREHNYVYLCRTQQKLDQYIEEYEQDNYVNYTSKMLGRDFDEYVKELKYNGLYAVNSGNNYYVQILERNQSIYNILYQGDEKTYRVGKGEYFVERDGEIIAYYNYIMIDIRYEKRPNVYQFLNNQHNISVFLEYEPEKYYLSDTHCLLKWEFQNGYLVINTMCFDDDWKLGQVLDYMFFKK